MQGILRRNKQNQLEFWSPDEPTLILCEGFRLEVFYLNDWISGYIKYCANGNCILVTVGNEFTIGSGMKARIPE